MEDIVSDKDILLYAISFLHANIDDMVEEDLSMDVHEIESRLRKILKDPKLTQEANRRYD